MVSSLNDAQNVAHPPVENNQVEQSAMPEIAKEVFTSEVLDKNPNLLKENVQRHPEGNAEKTAKKTESTAHGFFQGIKEKLSQVKERIQTVFQNCLESIQNFAKAPIKGKKLAAVIGVGLTSLFAAALTIAAVAFRLVMANKGEKPNSREPKLEVSPLVNKVVTPLSPKYKPEPVLLEPVEKKAPVEAFSAPAPKPKSPILAKKKVKESTLTLQIQEDKPAAVQQAPQKVPSPKLVPAKQKQVQVAPKPKEKPGVVKKAPPQAPTSKLAALKQQLFGATKQEERQDAPVQTGIKPLSSKIDVKALEVTLTFGPPKPKPKQQETAHQPPADGKSTSPKLTHLTKARPAGPKKRPPTLKIKQVQV